MRRRIAGLVGGTVLALLSASPGTALTMYADRAEWEAAVGAWLPVDESQISLTTGTSVLDLPGGGTLTFTGPGYPPGVLSSLWGVSLPTGNFPTWGSPGPSRVLWAPWADPDLVVVFSHGITAFGLELRPGGAQPVPRSMVLDLGPPGALEQPVGPEARFFGWTGGSVLSLELYAREPLGGPGFAIGRMALGGAGASTQQAAAPEPATLALVASGLALLAGLAARRVPARTPVAPDRPRDRPGPSSCPRRPGRRHVEKS